MTADQPSEAASLSARPAAHHEDGPTGCHPARDDFARGFLALLPLWVGAVPFGITYGVAARAAGLGVVETQLMSLLIFSAAGQLSAVSLLAAGAPSLVIVATTLVLTIHLLLLGLSLADRLALRWGRRLLVAFLLTDGAYGVTVAGRQPTVPFLLGAGVSMYVVWNGATLAGALLGQTVPDPRRLGVDVVVPLTFLAVLVPLLRRRVDLLVALVAAATTLALIWLGLGSLAILAAGLVGSLAGVWWTRRAPVAGGEGA